MPSSDVHYLLLSTALAWLMVMVASLVRARGWTAEGTRLAMGNRDVAPPMTPLAGRADRAAKNMLENLLFFAALLFAAHRAGAAPGELAFGAAVFFWARLVYFGLYLAGVPYVRTLAWAVAIVGMGVVARAALFAHA